MGGSRKRFVRIELPDPAVDRLSPGVVPLGTLGLRHAGLVFDRREQPLCPLISIPLVEGVLTFSDRGLVEYVADYAEYIVVALCGSKSSRCTATHVEINAIRGHGHCLVEHHLGGSAAI